MSSPPPTSVIVLNGHAIIVNPHDNVAVVKKPFPGGLEIVLDSGQRIIVKEAVPPGHRFAIRNIPAGELVLQYGQPIGTSLGIVSGEWVSQQNMSNDVPLVRQLPTEPAHGDLRRNEISAIPNFQGYRRADGKVGVRNYILVIPTSMCASHEATQIASVAEFTLFSRAKFPNVDGVVAIPHNKGCGCQGGSNLDIMMRTLASYAAHPNVGGVVFIDLGCEKTNLNVLERYLYARSSELKKPMARISIQSAGGTQQAVEQGLKAVESMLPEVDRARREEAPISELILGVKCGGSDALSGISANPALGYAADLLVACGGTVLMTEVPEFCGAEHILARRAKDSETAKAIYRMVDWYKEYAGRVGAKLAENPSPGNVRSGLLNITIKSLGAIAKAGSSPIEGVVEYSEQPKGRGVWLMQGPGYDQESTPGLVGAGAQLIVFTTGLGTTIGNAIAPVIKLASNTGLFERMPNDMGLNAGGIIDGTETIEQVGTTVFDCMREVASGKEVWAEIHKHREFQIWGEQAISL
jgi:altronate hydrolase